MYTPGGCHAADTDRGGLETSGRNVQHHAKKEEEEGAFPCAQGGCHAADTDGGGQET